MCVQVPQHNCHHLGAQELNLDLLDEECAKLGASVSQETMDVDSTMAMLTNLTMFLKAPWRKGTPGDGTAGDEEDGICMSTTHSQRQLSRQFSHLSNL